MADLFLSLFFISVLALVVGLIKPSFFSRFLKSNATRKRTSLIFGIATLLFFVLTGLSNNTPDSVDLVGEDGVTEDQKVLDIPQYIVLDRVEHIGGGFFGDILIMDDIESISFEGFADTAKEISDKEGLDRSVSFYTTEEAYKANVGVFISDEYEDINLQTGLELEEYQEYRSYEEIQAYIKEGYIGMLEGGEFNFSHYLNKEENYDTEKLNTETLEEHVLGMQEEVLGDK